MSDAPATLAGRFAIVQASVADACVRAGRDPSEVALLPVSKTFGADTVREAIGLGWRRFGENKVQEIQAKAAALADENVSWVVIGHLQTNKAKAVAALASEVQSLDRLDLAVALDKALQTQGRSLDVLVQVKTSPEETKHGLAPDDLLSFLDQLKAFSSLRLRGLMTLAEASEDESRVRACFQSLYRLRDTARQAGHSADRLSMGMSGDFALAIAEGSTEVRIGSAIFGARSYKA
ncbi:YggS family pyridoxal phosphate-dependent enzyme [Luteibacter flocculans]|uniref:Pyridoxal phosphate homeostasis protein n=1 Tax=Luteibacter flocculans TaxID=2780091 RepID=A0ABY4SYE9_9GAMM|nr:YggS family pyridoxal phosphate-dependent enzyme [Luteibacter flocculans]URL57306.1 YggS family pyridoxal phosphate-dependent enzyme [Luteibacter flocculans]